jgi:Zn-finger nucleic acid-binding protein
VKQLASPTRVQRRRFELSAEEKVKYVPCPACKNLMNRSNYGRRSGVVIDTCRNCGVWLDNNELNRILQFVESGGLEDARAMEEEEKKKREKEQRPAYAPTVEELGGPGAFKGAFGPRPPTLEVDLARALDFVVKLFIK